MSDPEDDPFGDSRQASAEQLPSARPAPVVPAGGREGSMQLDPSWGAEADGSTDYSRGRVAGRLIVTGPTSRVAFDALCHVYSERSQTAIGAASSKLVKGIGALLGPVAPIASLLRGDAAHDTAPVTVAQAELLRESPYPVTGLALNKYVRRVLEHRQLRPDRITAFLSDDYLDRPTVSLLHAPTSRPWRHEDDGTFTAQRPESLLRYAAGTVGAVGGVFVVAASLDALELHLARDSRPDAGSSSGMPSSTKRLSGFEAWFAEVDQTMDTIYSVAPHAALLLVLTHTGNSADARDGSVQYVVDRVLHQTQQRAVARARPPTHPPANVVAVVALRVEIGSRSVRGAISGEAIVSGTEVLASAVNTADGRFATTATHTNIGAPSIDISSPTELVAALDALVYDTAVDVCGNPTCNIPEAVLHVDSTLRQRGATHEAITETLSSIVYLFNSAGVAGAAERVAALRMMHSWGTILLHDPINTNIDPDAPGAYVCIRPAVMHALVAVLQAHLAPVLRDGSCSVPDNVVPRDSVEDPTESVFRPSQHVIDGTCFFTFEQALDWFAPVLVRAYPSRASAECPVVDDDVALCVDLLEACGMVVRQPGGQHYAPPYAARTMPPALALTYCHVAAMRGVSAHDDTPIARWIAVNCDPCGVMSALSSVLHETLAFTSIWHGADGTTPKHVASAWSNAMILEAGRNSDAGMGHIPQRTLVCVPQHAESGFPFPALLVVTLAPCIDGVPDAEQLRPGQAVLDGIMQALEHVQATRLPGLHFSEAVPCVGCLKKAVLSPSVGWVKGYRSDEVLTTPSGGANRDACASPGKGDMPRSLAVASDMTFFSGAVLEQLHGAPAAGAEGALLSARGSSSARERERVPDQPAISFPCPSCNTVCNDKTLRSRGLKVLVDAREAGKGLPSHGTAPAQLPPMPSFLPEMAAPLWEKLLRAMRIDWSDPQQRAAAPQAFAQGLDGLKRSLMFLQATVEATSRQRPTQTTGRQSPAEEEWDIV